MHTTRHSVRCRKALTPWMPWFAVSVSAVTETIFACPQVGSDMDTVALWCGPCGLSKRAPTSLSPCRLLLLLGHSPSELRVCLLFVHTRQGFQKRREKNEWSGWLLPGRLYIVKLIEKCASAWTGLLLLHRHSVVWHWFSAMVVRIQIGKISRKLKYVRTGLLYLSLLGVATEDCWVWSSYLDHFKWHDFFPCRAHNARLQVGSDFGTGLLTERLGGGCCHLIYFLKLKSLCIRRQYYTFRLWRTDWCDLEEIGRHLNQGLRAEGLTFGDLK